MDIVRLFHAVLARAISRDVRHRARTIERDSAMMSSKRSAALSSSARRMPALSSWNTPTLPRRASRS